MPIHLRVTHHGDDSVSAYIVLHGRDFSYARCPPLRGMSQVAAADQVTAFAIEINKQIARAIRHDEATRPTKEMHGADDHDPGAGPHDP